MIKKPELLDDATRQLIGALSRPPDRREPVELGNSVGSDVDAALTFAVHGRVVNEPLDRAARERELDARSPGSTA